MALEDRLGRRPVLVLPKDQRPEQHVCIVDLHPGLPEDPWVSLMPTNIRNNQRVSLCLGNCLDGVIFLRSGSGRTPPSVVLHPFSSVVIVRRVLSQDGGPWSAVIAWEKGGETLLTREVVTAKRSESEIDLDGRSAEIRFDTLSAIIHNTSAAVVLSSSRRSSAWYSYQSRRPNPLPSQ